MPFTTAKGVISKHLYKGYDAFIYAEETSRTFFMWEMTKETGFGFSFGFSSESSFQSGRTLFRKVKSIQYGSKIPR
jgi:hypothetical protein